MYFVPVIRDYFEVLNNIIDSLSGGIDLKLIREESLHYFFVNIKPFFTSLITFQWLGNVPYFPIYVPPLHSSLLKENLFLDKQISTFLSVLERPAYTDRKLVLGFLNSFFFSLPVSFAHLLTVRRVLTQGILSGIYSALGTVTGQILFVTCILLGLRSLIIPWLSFDFHYLICTLILLQNIYNTGLVRRFKLIYRNEKKRLKRVWLSNFILSWTEQICTFPYFGNLTFGPEPTALDIFNSNTEKQSYLLTATYLYGFFVGTLLFTALFCFLSIRLNNLIYNYLLNCSFAQWYNIVNSGMCSFTIALTFNTFSYYGLDYLFTAPLGFIPEDRALYFTGFSLLTIPAPISSLRQFNDNYYSRSLTADLSNFDRGTYIRRSKTPHYREFETTNFESEFSYGQDGYRPRFLIKRPRGRDKKQLLSKRVLLFVERKTNPLASMESMRHYYEEPNIPAIGTANNEKMLNFAVDIQSKRMRTCENFDYREDIIYRERDPGQTYKDFYKSLPKIEKNFRKSLLESHFIFAKMNLGRSVNGAFRLNYHCADFNFIRDEAEKYFKIQHWYENYGNRFFRFFDIHLFTLNQPTFQKLTLSQENLLFQKRLLLGSYYDSFRYYNKLPFLESFKGRYNLSKSYGNHIYSQKFKGTNKVVRRVFSITASPQAKRRATRLDKVDLKYDQPLYLKGNERDYKVFHEELSHQKVESTNFLEISDPTPFYAGWDKGLRKVVTTNRVLPRLVAGYLLNSPKTNKSRDFTAVIQEAEAMGILSKSEKRQSPKGKEYKILANFLSSNKVIPFTNWPLQLLKIKNEDQRIWKGFSAPTYKQHIPYDIQFEFIRGFSEVYDYRLWGFLDKDIEKINKEIDLTQFYSSSLYRSEWEREAQEDLRAPIKDGLVWRGNSVLKRRLLVAIEKKLEKPIAMIKKIQSAVDELRLQAFAVDAEDSIGDIKANWKNLYESEKERLDEDD